MAGVLIVDYNSLQTEIGNFLWNRSDLTSEIPTFIQLCEAQMNRRLQARLGNTRLSISIAAETLAVPADFNGAISILLLTASGTNAELNFMTPDGLNARADGANSTSETGQPDSYTVEGGNFRFFPIPDSAYTANLTYRQRIPPLASNSTNWLLTNHPDAYLFGSLLASAPWLRDDNRVQMWAQMFGQILDDIQTNSDRIESLATNLTPLSGSTVI